MSTEEVKEINNRFLGVSLTNINGTRQPMFNGVVGYISREWAGVGKLAKIASDGTIPNGVDENNSTLKTDGIVQLISTQHVEHAKDSERVMSDEVKKYCDTNNQQYPSIILVYYQDFGDGTKNRLYYDPNNNYEFNENVIIPAFLNDVGNYTLLNHMWTLNNAIRAWGNDINSGIGPV